MLSITNLNDNYIDANTNHFVLDLELENSGYSCARAVTISVQASSPFVTDFSPTTYPTDICDHDNIEIPLRLDPNAVGGTYPLTLTVSYTDDNSTNVYTFTNSMNLLVRGNSLLNAHIVNSNPINVYPGDTATISVLIENDGTFQATNINGVLTANQPLEVKSAQSYFSIGTLQPKQSYIATFSIEVPKDVDAIAYPLILSIRYSDARDTQSRTIPLFFQVKKKAIFKTIDAGSDILYKNDNNKIIRLKITNTGTDIAKEIKVQIQPQFPFTTDGSMKYIDELLPGQSNIIEFAINVDKDATIGNYGVDLILDFKDPDGNLLQDSSTAHLQIQNKGFFRAVFIDYWYLWLIALLIIILIVIRIIRRRKSHKK